LSFKLAILHFNILEKYPPTMNFISDVLTKKPKYQISVFTSRNTSPYLNKHFENVKIWRLGSVSVNSLKRYLSYLIFNFFGSVFLLIKRPDLVIVYETMSVFPAYIYGKIYRNKKIHIHYHEYVSSPEKDLSSQYMKYLYKREAKLLKSTTCSQTNEDRKTLFLNDNPSLNSKNVFIFPNLPPMNWWQEHGKNKKRWSGGKIKLVYVGVLDANSMYLDGILSLVKQNLDLLELTFFCQQISNSARILLDQYKSENIKVKSALNYYELPTELIKYYLGIILYNGCNLNHIYSIPNKVFEYLYCGLPVLADKTLISLGKSNIAGVYITEINNIPLFTLKEIISKPFIFIEQGNFDTLHLYNYLFDKQ